MLQTLQKNIQYHLPTNSRLNIKSNVKHMTQVVLDQRAKPVITPDEISQIL